MLVIKISLFVSKNQEFLRLDAPDAIFPKTISAQLNALGARYQKENGIYLIPYHQQTLHQLFEKLKGIAYIDYSAIKGKASKSKGPKTPPHHQIRKLFNQQQYIPPQHQETIDHFALLLEKDGLSSNTIQTYTWVVKKFIACTLPIPPDQVGAKELQDFYEKYLVQGAYSVSFQNQAINALKKFYALCLQRKLSDEDLSRPQKQVQLPEILSQEEITILLNETKNLKHKTLLATIYACGLRIGELCQLKWSDLDAQPNLIRVYNPSHGTTRWVPFPTKLTQLMTDYYDQYRPQIYLFEGHHKKPYTNSSAAKVFKKALAQSGINKKVNLHSLRHSFAVHLLENGTDIKLVQQILGHRNLKTTQVYQQLAQKQIQNIQSPFSNMFL